MAARGYARYTMRECGCMLRAMVSVSDDGVLQGLVCTDSGPSALDICSSCQQVCRALNAALEARSFTQAAGLKCEHLGLDGDSEAQLELGLMALHEAMLDAILEFESRRPAAAGHEMSPAASQGELAWAFG